MNAPTIGTKMGFECPACGSGSAAATYEPLRNKGGAPGWLFNCLACHPGPEYLAVLAKAWGARDGAAIKEDPRPYLPARSVAVGGCAGKIDRLPTSAELARWKRRLLEDSRASLTYLRRRGLSLRTVKRYGLGYGKGLVGWWSDDFLAFTIPVYDAAGNLVNVKRRFWPEEPTLGDKRIKSWTLARAGVQLYPDVPTWEAWVLLCAGELDALIARQHGLPAVSTTCGASLPVPLAQELAAAALPIIVAYDVGEEGSAEQSAARLQAEGASASAVPLGLPHPKDDLTDWWVKYGRSTKKLREQLAAPPARVSNTARRKVRRRRDLPAKGGF